MVGASSVAEASLKHQSQISLETGNKEETGIDVVPCRPGGMARLPFMKGGRENAGMACIGGPGLNCIAAQDPE